MGEDDERRDTSPGAVMGRGLRSTVGREATTFGFSILVTATFGIIQIRHGSPEIHDAVFWAMGAVASFTVLEGILSRGFRRTMPQHRSEVMVIGTALNFVSVLAGLGAAIGVSALVGTDAAWPLCPLAAASVYLLTESAEDALAEAIQRARGDPRAGDLEG